MFLNTTKVCLGQYVTQYVAMVSKLLRSCCETHLQIAVITIISSGFDTNKANGSFSMVLTHNSHLHVALNKRNFTCRLNCSYYSSRTRRI